MELKNQLKIKYKVFAIVLALLIFIGLAFVALNNTVKNMTGEGFQIFSESGGIVVNLYGNGYFIDFSPAKQAFDWIEEHWVLIPRCIRFIQYIISLITG